MSHKHKQIKKTGFLLIVFLFASNVSITRAYTLPSVNQINFCLGFIAGMYLASKKEAAQNPVTLETFPRFVQQVSKSTKNGKVAEYARLCARLVDDGLIGYVGNPAGIKVTNGSFVMIKSAPHYGLLGTTCVAVDALFYAFWHSFSHHKVTQAQKANPALDANK